MDHEHLLAAVTAFLSGSLLFLSGWVVLRFYRRAGDIPSPAEPGVPLRTWLFLLSYWLLVVALVFRVVALGTKYAWLFIPGLLLGITAMAMILTGRGGPKGGEGLAWRRRPQA